jgi:hypothetical protein
VADAFGKARRRRTAANCAIATNSFCWVLSVGVFAAARVLAPMLRQILGRVRCEP